MEQSVKNEIKSLCSRVVFYAQGGLLAQLSRRLEREYYAGIRRPSVVVVKISNNFSSEAEKPILFIFHIIL